MQRVRLRRFVLATALAVVAGVGLAGCQTQPGTAGYVGSTRFTDAQIDSTATQVQADVDKVSKGSKYPDGALRSFLAQFSVFNELARQYAAERNITVPASNYDAASAQIHLGTDDPYVQLVADVQAVHDALLAKATPVTPTDDDLKAAYDQILQVPQLAASIAPFEQAKSAISGLPGFSAGVGLKAELSDAAKRYGVGVSPRYTNFALPVFTYNDPTVGPIDLVTLTLSQSNGTPPVTDLPSPTQAPANDGTD
jgi:hypothetical protein